MIRANAKPPAVPPRVEKSHFVSPDSRTESPVYRRSNGTSLRRRHFLPRERRSVETARRKAEARIRRSRRFRPNAESDSPPDNRVETFFDIS
ncbi:hypothetical protein [Burkholderia pseudomallei]|uniref:hypothetical protein n=1 Tax=Burkholderia pseudomallei TaxID=28450 RepID=UPI0009B1CCF2|nr:hypothetical protein [Burkholderia pseudomallei]